MLRITQNSHAAGARSYYSTADYYSEGQELTGHWRGKGARSLGLEGQITQPEWDALCDNRHPQSGDQLTPRFKAERTVGYDFNWHVPKSVSLLYALTRDERLLEAFRQTVDETMRDIESEMATRVRKGGKNEDRRTGNMVWGEFVHFTSRPVAGIPDPHLHAHCFVFNTTFDKQEQAWKAGQFRELKRDAPYFEAAFHARLAYRLADLGLPIERTKKGWELAGVSPAFIEEFSRRTAQIEDKARQLGLEDAEAKAELGAKTRDRKQKELSFPQLQEAWRERMTPEEIEVLSALEQKLGGEPAPRDGDAAHRAMEYALSHSFERKSVVPERQVLATALRQAVGQATVEEVLRQASASDFIVGLRDGRRMATTREVLAEERRVIDFARKGRGSCKPLGDRERPIRREWLNSAQRKAVEHILSSRDRVMIVRGAAGVGKTSLMKEAVEAIQEAGTDVFAFAPSAEASRGVLRGEGFSADTVARLLLDEDLQRQAAGQLIWIDEAGLLGMKTLANVFDLADRIDARILLTGDRRQHGSVERGAALGLLEEEAGIMPAEVKDILRQKGEYKEAVKALSEGRSGEGFSRLDRLGWVKEMPAEDRYEQLAADYVQAVAKGHTALVVSPTHAEAERITGEIRDRLQKAGAIAKDAREFTVLVNANLTEAERGDRVNFQPGDVLQFHQNAKGFRRGERLTVDPERGLPLDQAKRFQKFIPKTVELAAGDRVRITHNGTTADGRHTLNNGTLYRINHFDRDGNIILDNGWVVGRHFGHLAHGYVVTSHASQGKTVDHVFIGQSLESFGASSREQFYVSVSRGRKTATVYTSDKEALREAVSEPEDRVTATEFVNGTPVQQIVPLRQQQQREQEWGHERPQREREFVYER